MPPVFMRRRMASDDPANHRIMLNLQHRSVACRDRRCHQTIESTHRRHVGRACTVTFSSFRENTN